MATQKFISLLRGICFRFLFFVQTFSAHSQVIGCKDATANYYNPSATTNHGSCTYYTTFYTPPVKVDPISTKRHK